MTETQADELIEQYNENLSNLIVGMSEDELKAVMNAKNAILECINGFGDQGWVALSLLLSDMNDTE